MAIRDIFRISRRTFFNPVGWMDFDSLSNQTRTIWTVLKGLFEAPRPIRDETFDQAMKRLKLSEKDIKNGIVTYRWFALAFAILGSLVFIYSLYLLFHYVTFSGLLLGTATAALLFSQAFRFDFWALQMQERKLGITFEDWKASWLGKKGSSA